MSTHNDNVNRESIWTTSAFPNAYPFSSVQIDLIALACYRVGRLLRVARNVGSWRASLEAKEPLRVDLSRRYQP